MNPWKPLPFQGASRRSRYFEGWYFKQVSAERSRAWSFIPGVSLPEEGRGCAFIQAIDGETGRTWWFEYPLEDFDASTRELRVRVGKSMFSASGIILDLGDGGTRIAGELRFGPLKPLPFRLLSPNAMGPYSFVPFMECKHGLVSLDHAVEGSFSVGGGRGRYERQPRLHREGLGLLHALELDLDPD